MMTWTVYLSGEIHSDWRDEIARGSMTAGLAVIFTRPVTHHEASDDVGVALLGSEPDKFWHDHKGAQINAIRTRSLIEKADIVVVRFGEKYRQWNAAFDAGFAAALGKPLIVMHQDEHAHALKEVDAAALAVTSSPEQVVAILRYVIDGDLPGYTDKAASR
nr:YtoQ family protein [Hoeflea marina]